MSLETIVLVAIPIVAIVAGLSWILYPAWVVLFADDLEWDVDNLPTDGGGMTAVAQQQQQQQPLLSVVVPAYNEQDRIESMLRAAHGYLTSPGGQELLRRLQACARLLQSEYSSSSSSSSALPTAGGAPPISVEWVIVNDGSRDGTYQVVRTTHDSLQGGTGEQSSSSSSSAASHRWEWKVITLRRNSGKGAAVKTGMLLSTGLFRLMVDADGATDFGPGLQRLTEELQSAMEQAAAAAASKGTRDTGSSSSSSTSDMDCSMFAVFGSRAHLEKDSTIQRSFIRTLLMKAFHFFVSLFVSSKVRDTQCGFKMFTQASSLAIFRTLHLRRWAFDTEVVKLCDSQKIQILEVGVPWQEVDGSKLSTSKWALAIVSISMLRDMICVWMCYTFGIWKVKSGTGDKKLQ